MAVAQWAAMAAVGGTAHLTGMEEVAAAVTAMGVEATVVVMMVVMVAAAGTVVVVMARHMTRVAKGVKVAKVGQQQHMSQGEPRYTSP